MRGRPDRAIFTPTGRATFPPTGQAVFAPVEEATFELDTDVTFEPENDEGWTRSDLDAAFLDTPEDRFLRGEVLYVGAASSTVEWFQWLGWYPDGQVQDQLYVGFQDGSVYEYDGVSLSESLLFFRADSPNGCVWDNLRIRGTVFGYKKNYRLVSGSRVWNQSNASIARHEAIPAGGEPFAGYHPATNFAGAPGKMGQPGANLNRRRGSSKKAYFTPVTVFQPR